MAWFTLIPLIPIVLFNNWRSVSPFDASNFFSSYVNLAFFALLFIGWKLWHKTRWVSLDEMDISSHYTEGEVVHRKL